MAIVTGDRYLEKLVTFVDHHAGPLIESSLVLKLNPAGLHYVHSRLESLHELENLVSGAPVDYLRAYVSDLGDYRALEQLRRILRLLTSLKVVSVLPPPTRDPTPLSLLPFERLKVLELRGCDLSTSAARGLLELRLTLEKIVCHNSTDALRHVFASRIVDIKDSPQWNKLTFVSCASNRLILMDESLQLLPAVETLDLSRNKFSKVDNLRKCVKLKHLDLGFNHLRRIDPFRQVSCNLVRLVLRNNALTTLHGLENLKSLEHLDVSYNILSNFLELEVLSSLPSLYNLWLEGNPLCCARCYRAQVFSYFSYPYILKLDDKPISTREYWERHIMVASRHKRPASFGFYSPAKDDALENGCFNKKKQKVSRLASIKSNEDSISSRSDQESSSHNLENQNKEENTKSDDEAEIFNLINRVEHMKKERSSLWLKELKEWMDPEPMKSMDCSIYNGPASDTSKGIREEDRAREKHQAEGSRFTSDYLQASEDGTSTNVFDSGSSFMDVHSDLHGARRNMLKSKNEGLTSPSMQSENSHLDNSTIPRGWGIVENVRLSPLATIDDATDSNSSSNFHGSPPHYQKDLLRRRNHLVEEIMQFSAGSYSAVSSDTDTTASEDEFYDAGRSMSEVDGPYLQTEENCNPNLSRISSSVGNCEKCGKGNYMHHLGGDKCILDSRSEQTSSVSEMADLQNNGSAAVSYNGELPCSSEQEAHWVEKRKCRRKARRKCQVAENLVECAGGSDKSNDSLNTCDDTQQNQSEQIVEGNGILEAIDKKWLQTSAFTSVRATVDRSSENSVEKHFNETVADSTCNETCVCFVFCNCVLEPEASAKESEVVLIRSSENKLYLMLIGVASICTGNTFTTLHSHKLEDVIEVTTGIGLQLVRVNIQREATYLFLTRSIAKLRQLFYTLDLCGSSTCSLRSLEQIQLKLFEQKLCGGSRTCIYQYSMVLLKKGASWELRSLFVVQGSLLVCIEDLKQFGIGLEEDPPSSVPYFILDARCSIDDIVKLVYWKRVSEWMKEKDSFGESDNVNEDEQPIQKKMKMTQPISIDRISSSRSSILIADDEDLLVSLILSRLPVKSLMKFKCVSKGWKSIIEKDAHLIKLHLTRSEPGFLIVAAPCVQPYCYDEDDNTRRGYDLSFLSTDLNLNVDSVKRIQSSVKCLGPVRGLLCFVDGLAVQIFNVGTGEVTPWLKPECFKHFSRLDEIDLSPQFFFGMDPSSGKHKVLCLSGKYEAEVLTVGEDSSWRIIDDDEAGSLEPQIYTKIVAYANGSIYWFEKDEIPGVVGTYSESLVAFDVGSEKFRMIPIPISTRLEAEMEKDTTNFSSKEKNMRQRYKKVNNRYCADSYSYDGLIEMDGCLTLIRRRYQTVKMWKFHDYDKKENGINSEQEDWSPVEDITLPDDITSDVFVYFHPIPGKRQLMLETYVSSSDWDLDMDTDVDFYDSRKGQFFQRNVKFARMADSAVRRRTAPYSQSDRDARSRDIKRYRKRVSKWMDDSRGESNNVNEDEQQIRKKMKKTHAMSIDHISSSTGSSLIADDEDLLVSQILARLPVKSLMKFKCVCKGWKSIIEKDAHYLTLSESRPAGFLIVVAPRVRPFCYGHDENTRRGYDLSFLSADLHLNVDSVKRIQSSVKFLGPVRGLLCLVDGFAVQIFNVGTGEVTPWLKPGSLKHYSTLDQMMLPRPQFFFGMDPSSGKHKVLCMPGNCEPEVLTVGEDSSWRIIDGDDAVSRSSEPDPFTKIFAYANGSIYWFEKEERRVCRGSSGVVGTYSESLVAFDVGSEKFRRIPTPIFTRLEESNRAKSYSFDGLIEMDGCLTLIRRRDQMVKMWKYHDYDKKENGSSIEKEEDWSQVEEIKLPHDSYLRSVAFAS
ncbi:Serine/threonine-protein kinase 11-interacting protein [Linum grandiflorum]